MPEKIESTPSQEVELDAHPDSKKAIFNLGNLLDIYKNIPNNASDSGKPGKDPEDNSGNASDIEKSKLPKVEIEDHSGSESSDQAQKSRQWFEERFEEITGQESVIEEGPEKELNNWADSWKDSVEAAEVPESPFRVLLQDLGSQMILGKFDQQKLAQEMRKIEENEELKEVIEDLNNYGFKSNGVKLSVQFDNDGKMTSIELAKLPREGESQASFKVDRDGKLTASGVDREGKPLTEEDTIKEVAKKASPLACP